MGKGAGFVFFIEGRRKGFKSLRREASGAADQRTVALGKVVTGILMERMD